MPQRTLTKKEIKERASKEAATAQMMRYHQEKRPELEERGLEIARSYAGADVSNEELSELEKKTGLFSGYIIIALLHKLGYNIYIDKNRKPERYQKIYTRRCVCPKCGEIIFGYKKEEQ